MVKFWGHGGSFNIGRYSGRSGDAAKMGVVTRLPGAGV
jgi:hypothetical protein